MSRFRSGAGGTFLRNAWLVGAVTAASLAVAAWWASTEGPRWRSTAFVDIEPGAAGAAIAGLDALGASFDRSALEVLADPSGRALEIRFEAGNPQAAMRGARVAVEAARAASLAGGGDEAVDAVPALEAEVLDVASRAVAAWAELERLRTMDRRTRLDSDRRTWEELLAAIARARSSGPAEAPRGAAVRRVPDPEVESVRSRWAGYRSQRATLLSGPAALAANHPDVQRLSTLIAATEVTLEGLVRGRIAVLAAANLEPTDPAGSPAADAGAAADTLQLLATLAALEQRAAELQEEIAGARAREAVPPAPAPLTVGQPEPVPADPWRELLIGLVAGLLLGSVAVAARDRFGAGDAPAVPPAPAQAAEPAPLPQPELPPVPEAEAGSEEVPMLAVVPAVVPTLVEPLENGDFRPGPGQEAGLAAYRELRNRLVDSRWGLKTLVVTSAHPGEGKTTTSTNLAATYARQGLKVVLIECDLRRPSLGRYFRITKQIDLMDVLFEGRDWRLALQLTRTPGLYAILGEKSFPQAGDSLGGPEMKRLLAEITREYDLVILDSSPLLVAADATVLGPIVDGVLVVVRPTRTDPPTVGKVVEQLRKVGATVVGTVLNDPDGVAAEWLTAASRGPRSGHTGSETRVPPRRSS